MDIKERIKELCKINGVSMNKVESDLNFGKGYIKKKKKSTPNASKIRQIADYFDVTVDYLISGKESSQEIEVKLTRKDEKDIARRLKSTLEELENNQDGLMFSGEPLDDETRELLKASLENSIRIAKINAKQKFTPKKYRKDQ